MELNCYSVWRNLKMDCIGCNGYTDFNTISSKCSGVSPNLLNLFEKDNSPSVSAVTSKCCSTLATKVYRKISAMYFPMQYRGPTMLKKENSNTMKSLNKFNESRLMGYIINSLKLASFLYINMQFVKFWGIIKLFWIFKKVLKNGIFNFRGGGYKINIVNLGRME